MPDIKMGEVKIVATGSVGWPSPDEIREIILNRVMKMTDAEILEFYKMFCDGEKWRS